MSSAAHAARPSGLQLKQHQHHQLSHPQPPTPQHAPADAHPPPKLQRNFTAPPEYPHHHLAHHPQHPQHHSLLPQRSPFPPPSPSPRLRLPLPLPLPSSSSPAGAATTATAATISTRPRRATNPPLSLAQQSTSSATAAAQAAATERLSYFSPQTAASGKESRSPKPPSRRPPASFSGHGIDTSRGPPITLANYPDIARRASHQPSSLPYAQHPHPLQPKLASPSAIPRRKDDSEDSSDFTAPSASHASTPNLSRHNSVRTARGEDRHMARSGEESSDYDSGMRSQSEDAHTVNGGHGAIDTSGTDEEHTEDLFLNIAEDNSPRAPLLDSGLRSDRLRSRIARSSNNRQSFPSAIYSPSPVHSTTSTAPSVSRIPASIDTKAATPYRRASALPTSSHLPTSARLLREQSPLSPAYPPDMSRSRLLDLSPKPSFSSSTKTKDTDMSPREFLSQMGRRRPSHPDALQTPPNRTSTYRPSNLHYSSSRDTSKTPCPDTPQDTSSRVDGTESQSQNSTGPAASVWDELDDLKTRIRKIELGGKIPTTSGAAVAQASAERPRTANTSVTTVSSSPKQQRKANASPAESTVGAHTPQKVHPLLKEALAKARQHLSPAIYRVLEATASEALELAELTGSAGPQGTLQSASSVLAGASVPDRQVRRKADNICRSLTELCIAMCDPKSSLASPALRTTIATGSRRPSVQVNGESPSARQGIESDTSPLPRTSPSRALSRIEARRASMMAMSVNGSPREASQETPTPSQSQIPTRLARAGTSFNRSRKTPEEDDEDLTLRAPSRALTDFRDTRQKSRANREYTSREPLPDLQPAPSIQPTVSLRRPTVTGSGNENHLLYRDGSRRYNIDRQNSPAYEKQVSTDLGSRLQYNPNRNSIGSISALDRSASIPRRYRGASVGE